MAKLCKKIQVQNQFSCSLKTLTENFIWMHVLCGAAIKDLGCLHLMRRRRKKVWISSNNEPLMYAISKRNSARHSIQMQMALIGIDHRPNKINTPSVSFVIVVYTKFKKYLSINAAYKKSIRTLLNKSFPFVGARVIFFRLILLNLTYSRFGVLLFCIYQNPNYTMNLWFLNLIPSFFAPLVFKIIKKCS